MLRFHIRLLPGLDPIERLRRWTVGTADVMPNLSIASSRV